MYSSSKLQVSWRDLRAHVLNRSSSVSNRSMFKQLYHGRESVNRHVPIQDPLCLPPELVTHIFSHLRCDEISFVDLPIPLSVSITYSYPNCFD